MRTARTDTGTARRVARITIGGTAALAIIGGSMLTATAANASTYSCLTTAGTTSLVDFAGGGTGLINTGSSGGLLGIATGANGLQVGLLSCTAVVNVGGSTTTGTGVTVLTGTPGVPTTPIVPIPTTPTTGVPTGTPTTSTPGPATTDPGTGTGTGTGSTPTTAPAPAAPTTLADLKVSTTAATVYPAKDGYKDKVTFSIKGLNSSATGVKITGKAVLKKGTKVVKTWTITEKTSKLSWNGRIGKKVKAGLYRLTVTAWSADGVKKTSTMKVRVSAKHLVSRTVMVKSTLGGSATTAKAPAKVLKALELGKVTVRIRTVADVHGPAKLVFANKGVTKTLALKDGTHTTKALPVPKGFSKVKIAHRWKQGAATLKSLHAVWSYKKLI